MKEAISKEQKHFLIKPMPKSFPHPSRNNFMGSMWLSLAV
jgi:hypothetical protein